MEVGSKHRNSLDKKPFEGPKAVNGGNKPVVDNNSKSSVFVNHGANAWHEGRSKWRGDHPQQSKKKQKDPIISWSTTYEDLLSTNDPFSEPIPLTEMVDFLVDIWLDEGLYD